MAAERWVLELTSYDRDGEAIWAASFQRDMTDSGAFHLQRIANVDGATSREQAAQMALQIALSSFEVRK